MLKPSFNLDTHELCSYLSITLSESLRWWRVASRFECWSVHMKAPKYHLLPLWSHLKPKCREPLIQIEKANCLSHRKGRMSWCNSNVGAKAGSKTSPLGSSIEIQIIDEQLDESIASVWKLKQGNLPGPKWALDYFKFKFNHLVWLAGAHVSLPFWDMSPFLRALRCWSGLGFRSSFLHTFFSFSPAISDDDNEGKKCLTSHPQALFFSQLRDHWVLKAMASRKSEPDDISAHHHHDSDGSANINQKQTVLDTDVERRAGGDEGPLPTEKLRRGLSARQVQMIAIAGTIGTGLFLGTGRSLAQGGPASIFICYGVVGFIVYVTLLLLGEMGTQYPVAGMC